MSAFPKAVRAASLALTCLLGVAAAQGAAPATPAPAAATPAKAAANTPVSGTTSRAASSVAIEVSAAVKGQIVSCPGTLKVGPAAVCLYVKASPASVRPLIRAKLGARALGDWKTTGKASSLLVGAAPGGAVSAYVLLAPLTEAETLLVVDAAPTVPAAQVKGGARPATPAGTVKGQPYVLGRDLAGVVNVSALGGGKFRLSRAGGDTLTVTAGQKTAQMRGGTVELPLAPTTDGTNLILPLAALRALGCTLTPAGSSVTVACGAESVGLKPIVF
ncbi:hypothetical protein [Deinococcus hopiensis]|uniref:Copper amine oxidase N-terminal domain-containing protein n=1 Tax=Deinococcus hopiensis KR-140 TaxID=695939 RepID=A0A1W1VKP3_9DEIO|nr:hypothetical protein [Deinococcus hopiensis]SMB93524.1 hypothetical protein SAMN00790413_02020 [Deinococcus hopiensis KR-140]